MGEGKDKNVIRSSPNFVYRTIAGQHVLVSIGEGLADFRGYIQLNDTAAFLWEELKTGRTREELLRAMMDKYDVDEAAARRDLDDLIDLFSSKGMLLQ